MAPWRLLLVYVDDTEDVEKALGLSPGDAGGNVAILTTFDDVVFERTCFKGGVTAAALSQAAAELAASPGRGPKEGEALLERMRQHEGAWRV